MNNWTDTYQSLDLKSGKIEFICEDDQDMIEICYDDGMLIDVGYIEDYKKYFITVVESHDVNGWEKPLAVREIDFKEKLFSEIQKTIFEFRNKEIK